MVDFKDIQLAFEYTSFGSHNENKAYLNIETGAFCFYSPYDDSEDLPDDIDFGPYISIPSKHDLNLGKHLVLDFAHEYLPDESREVHEIFSRKGAYSRFKDFLANKGLLETWYEYEDNAQNKALRGWCEENAIQIDTDGLPSE